jgi:spore germination cell wall hydrolase CwlJ-like protein
MEQLYDAKYTPAQATQSQQPAVSDERLLARLTYSEAAREDIAGKGGVASVVRNRVLSSQFPNTYSGVINQPRQFDAVGGSLWTNHFDAAGNFIGFTSAMGAYRDSFYIARQVIAGTIRDPTGGAVFFHSGPVPRSWLSAIGSGTLYQTVAIGRHRFYAGHF